MADYKNIQEQNQCKTGLIAGSAEQLHRFFFQPKLTFNQPNDVYEQEADAIADKVMRMEQPVIQLKPLPITTVQRKCEHCEEEEKIQRKEIDEAQANADNNLENYVGGLSSSGQPLPNEARNFYEPRFGYDFSNVKIHTDAVAAKSAKSVNALAYTSGSNIIFNEGQYNTNTDSGKQLLGHELTHVVQQSATKKMLQKKDDKKFKLLSPAELLEACVKKNVQQAEDLLQWQVGLLTHIDRSIMLEELFGAELPDVTIKIKSNADSKKFVCEYGISGMMALEDTQKKDGNYDVPAAKIAVDTDIISKAGKYGRKATTGWRIAEKREERIRSSATSIGTWAKVEDRRKDDIPSPSAALNMPVAQVAEISQMIANTELLSKHFPATSKLLTDTQVKLDTLSKVFKDIIPSQIFIESFGSDISRKMNDAKDAAESFRMNLFGIAAGRINVSTIYAPIYALEKNIIQVKDMAIAEQQKMLASDTPDFSDMKDLIRETKKGPLANVIKEFGITRQHIEKFALEIPKLIFILKYFKALNDSKSTPPTEKEMNDFNGKLDSIDTSLFFGSSPVNPGLEIMSSVIDFIKKQIAVRLEMKAATGNLPDVVPSLSQVEAYFTTMNNKTTDNAAVRKAYENFAQAYFQHRGEAITMQDLNISGITDVFSMPVSITGSRTIVCGAYAQMGSALMSRAGATKRLFTIAVRASNEQVESGEIDAGHAIVQVTRQSGTFFISNYLTASTEAEAMEVAWEHPDFPMHKASSSSYTDAVTKLSEQLAKLRKP